MMSRPLLFQRIYHENLQSRLDFGHSLQAAFGPQLLQDQAFADAFKDLGQAADTLAGYMAALGMGELCVACSANNPGGCCSREMAEETDALQMLMNMLVGVKVTIAEDDGRKCCFLGPRGCIFPFKPMFCLNYNCDRIIARIGSARPELELLTGRLLGKQYEVERMLLARIECLKELTAG